MSSSAWRVPFNRPSLAGNECELMGKALENHHIAGDGPFTWRCEALLEESLGVPRALLTTSCTHALELAALLLDLSPADEVIVPSFTFVSTAGAFALRGARIVFADVRPDTLNVDEKRLAELVTSRTRAIVVVHYAGVGCEMDEILRLADGHGIPVIEDNAHGLYGEYRGRPLGRFGNLGAQSFHETKNFTCGEGGALLVNDEQLIEQAEVIRDKGTDRKRFLRGEVSKYTWAGTGSSYVLSDLLAAFLAVQLEARKPIQSARRRIWLRYEEGLSGWAKASGARLPVVPEHCEHPYHLFYLLLPSEDARTALISHLRARSILAVFHYVPLHLSPMGVRQGGKPGQCPVTEDVSERLLRLPFYTNMTVEEQEEVIDGILAFSVD